MSPQEFEVVLYVIVSLGLGAFLVGDAIRDLWRAR